MMVYIIVFVLLTIFLLLVPKFTSGRILFTEAFVPELQAYRPAVKRDLSDIKIRVEIVYRKLYRIRVFKLFKPVFELLPSNYTVKTEKDGRFFFWAYPYDVVNIYVGEEEYRLTYTLRHKVNGFWPRYANFILAISSLFSPKLVHGECIEIPSTMGNICGYADRISAFPGETIDLKISTKAETYSLELVRVGEELQSIEKDTGKPGMYQNIETPFPSTLGCGWKSSLKYNIPEGIDSGCYIIKLEGQNPDDNSFIPIIVKPLKVEKEIAVIASTNTWHAYNSWGGQNYYINYTSYPSLYTLSMQRPFDLPFRNPVTERCEITRDHLLVGERLVWAWLEREGLSYDLYSDLDLHDEDIFSEYLMKYKAIIINTHNEYWSYDMVKHLKQFIQGGGNVLSLSGNTMYKEVTFPDQNSMLLDGAYFKYQGFREETVIGIGHDLRGFTTWEPYRVVLQNHWVFDGTGLKNGDVIGQKGLNVALDDKPGASGWETDKITPYSPEGTTLLARGANAGGGGADIIIYKLPDGGSVFSVGSISFGGSLLVDDKISKITKNVIKKFLT